MRYTRSFISFFILTMLVGLGSLVLSTDQVRAGFSPCDIEIVKIAIPADNTPFNFSVPELNNFVLNDPDNDSTMFTLTDKNRTANVTENVPSGWILDDIDCESGQNVTISEISNGISFSCSGNTGSPPASFATCTFFNVGVVTSTIPTISEWGLIAMAGILGIIGFMVIRRRKVTA